MVVDTFKEWPFWCDDCQKTYRILAWGQAINDQYCEICHSHVWFDPEPAPNKAPGIIGDDIPGGVEIRHGLVNDDGSPRKFYSKTEIKRAANEAGLNWADDTPGPYRIPWSGRVKKEERPAPLVKADEKVS